MKSVRDTLKRVRWNVVLGILIVFIMLALILTGNIPFSSRYTGDGDIVMRSWVTPDTVELTDECTVWTEVRNRGRSSYHVDVKLVSKSSNLTSVGSGEREINKSVEIGPGESRSVPFYLKVHAVYGGVYGVDIYVVYNHREITDGLYLNVRK